jgi:protoheme ferro-lyase
VIRSFFISEQMHTQTSEQMPERMSKQTLFSIIESSGHPNASELYHSIGIQETKINSMRKAIAAIKKQAPDFIVAEFFYGYGNNYAGVNISNLDVLLHSMQRYAADTKVIVLVQPDEYKHVDKLNEIIKLHDILKQPVTPQQLYKSLQR